MATKRTKGGRPSKFEKGFIDLAYKLCLLGLTDDKLAQFFKVGVPTFNRWKHEHPEFQKALKRGRSEADGKVVESLYKQALDGNVTAQIFWLKNRHREYWRDKQDHAHSGTIKHQDANFSDTELLARLDFLFERGGADAVKQALAGGNANLGAAEGASDSGTKH